MSIQHANRGIVKKDLQVYYNREWIKSFKGEPTTNLVFDGFDTFERTVSTYNTANCTAVRSTDVSYFGDYSLKIFRASSGADSFADMEGFIQVTPSTTYTYSAYVYPTAVATDINILRPVSFTSAGVYQTETSGGTITATDVGKWKRVSVTFTVPSNCTQVVLRLNFGGTNAFPCQYYVDGRQLEEKGYVTPFVRSYQTGASDIVPRREKAINWFRSYGTSGQGAAADNAVSFVINGNGTFVRLGYGQTFGGYTIKPDDVVYKYNLDANGCHYHGNTISIRSGEYAVFTCDYFISEDAVNPGTNGNNSTLLVFENYGGNAPSGNIAVPSLTKGVWNTCVLSSTAAGAGLSTVAAFLYPGYCASTRFATGGYLLMKNPTLTIHSSRRSVAFKYPGNSYTPNLTNVTQAIYGNSVYTKSAVGPSWSNARIYSTEGYTSPAYVSFYPSQNNLGLMIALNSDPASGIAYGNLDYAWYPDSTGQAYIFENGSNVLTAGAYTSSTFFEIIYDGLSVNYYMDGVLKRSVPRTSNSALYLDSSFYSDNAQVNTLGFGPYVTNTPSDNAGLTDLSGNDVNANLMTVSFNSTGYYLAGTSSANRIQFTTPTSFIYSAAGKTVLMWIKYTATGYICFCGLGNAANGQSFNLRTSNTYLGFMGYNADYDPSAGPQLNNDVWHLIGATFDAYGAGTLRLYVDGANTASTTLTLNTGPEANNIGYIGRSSHGSGNEGYFGGQVGQFMMYNRSLSADEILQIFNSQRKTYGV